MGSQHQLGVCTTEVRPGGQGEVKGNEARIAAAVGVVEGHPGGDVQVFAFPAGYLRARDEREVAKVTGPIIVAAKAHQKAVLVGVDAERVRPLPERRVREGTLPFFLVAWAPGLKAPVVWRQRSRTSTDAALANAEQCEAPRVLTVAGHRLCPLISGEIFNPAIRAGVAAAGPQLAILCAHSGGGARHWAGQNALRDLGVASVRSLHASNPARQVLTGRTFRLANEQLSTLDVTRFVYLVDGSEIPRRKAA